MKPAEKTFRKKAVPAESVAPRPLPELCGVDYVRSGFVFIGGAEHRLERFDCGWVITFLAEWSDGSGRMLCWKVYPQRQSVDDAIESLRRRARDCGIVRLGIVEIDRPEGKVE